MKVLGIYFGQCSGSAFFVDGRIVFASSEERYSRKKSDEAYPFHSINAGLKYCKIKPEELDKVVIAGIALPWISVLLRMYSNFSVQDQLLAMEKYWRPKLAKKTHQSLLELFESKISPDNHPFKNVISNFDSILRFCEICKYMKLNGLACELHRRQNPDLGTCAICMENREFYGGKDTKFRKKKTRKKDVKSVSLIEFKK